MSDTHARIWNEREAEAKELLFMRATGLDMAQLTSLLPPGMELDECLFGSVDVWNEFGLHAQDFDAEVTHWVNRYRITVDGENYYTLRRA